MPRSAARQSIEAIERVYSHIQALGQAERFLRTRPWSLLTTYNTAGAGRFIVDQGDRHAAAVLSRRAADAFGFDVLAGIDPGRARQPDALPRGWPGRHRAEPWHP